MRLETMIDHTMKITHAIPIPKRSQGRWQDLARKMLVGDSVLVKTQPGRCSMLRALHKLMAGYTSRKINRKGYRIWRTA